MQASNGETGNRVMFVAAARRMLDLPVEDLIQTIAEDPSTLNFLRALLPTGTARDVHEELSAAYRRLAELESMADTLRELFDNADAAASTLVEWVRQEKERGDKNFEALERAEARIGELEAPVGTLRRAAEIIGAHPRADCMAGRITVDTVKSWADMLERESLHERTNHEGGSR